MLIDWTSNIKDPEAKAKFEDAIRSARPVLQRLFDISSNLESQIDRIETNIKVYDTPNWDVRQAHKNGNRETLNYYKTLIKSAL